MTTVTIGGSAPTDAQKKALADAFNLVTFDPASGIPQSGYGPYDLLVYGATPSGISAAVAAARQGMKSAIFEPTGWIGGMMTGGIAHTDVSETVQKGVVVNWPGQLFRRIAEDGYGILQNNYWVNSYNGEPSMNMRFIARALKEAGVQVVLNAQLASVSKSGAKILTATFTNCGTVSARCFVDATYEGDLSAAAGCTTVIGRESNSTYGETNNGVRPLATGPVQFPDGVDPSSMTPFTDQKRMQQTAPSAAAPKPAPSIAAPSIAGPGPSIDRIAPAGDATAPTAAIATPPAAPAGVANAADIDRSKMTNAQVAAANPAGQVRAVRGANGVMEFSGSNVSGPVSYADAQGNAIAGQGVTGRGWGGGVTSMPARGSSPSTATSSALSGALSDAVARGDMDAVQRYYFSRGQSFGGKTEQQVRADNLMAQAQNLMNRGHVGDAQKAQMLLSTLGTMEQNANTARGFDVQRDMANTRDAGETARANARNAIDQGKLELDQKARGFDFRLAQRQEELYQRYQNAKTPEERNAIAQQIRDLKGTAAPASWKAVALQGGTDAMGNKTEGVLAAVNEQTGEVRRLDSGQGGAKEAAPTEVGQRKAGTVYSLPNGKLGRWTSQGWELVD